MLRLRLSEMCLASAFGMFVPVLLRSAPVYPEVCWLIVLLNAVLPLSSR